MISDTNAGRGSTYLLKSTVRHLSWLRTAQQEVPHGFQLLEMLFYQQELKSCTDSPKPITSDSLNIHAYKYYATTGRQPIVDK